MSQLTADPVAQTFRSLAVARCLGVVARLGLLRELANKPVDILSLALQFELQPEPLRMMLDVLVGEGYLDCRGDAYWIAPAASGWLDPEAATSVTAALSYTLDYWDWWAELDQVAAGGAVASTSPAPEDELGWLRRSRAHLELARMIGDEVVEAINLPRQAQSILELGSTQAWYSILLCRRNPMLRSTIIDQASASAAARELTWEAGMDRVISHREGDIFTADLGGVHDAVFCLPLLTGLDDQQVGSLLQRVRAVLSPGGLLVTLRHSVDALEQSIPSLAWHELFLRLAARPDPSTPAQFRQQLHRGGFGVARVQQLASAPELSLHVARAI